MNELKKNVFIGGVARSGKSTFAKKINKNGNYNHIPLDYFTSSLKHNFPELGITSNVIIDKESSKKLSLLLSRVINIMNESEEYFIIDSAHIMPNDIIKYLDRDKWDIYFIGYPKIDSEEKLNIIRKYDTNKDWTFKKTDEELLTIIKELVNLSKEIEQECIENNIEFIDTSDSLLKKIENIQNI